MQKRSVAHIAEAHPLTMGNLPVKQPLPTQQVDSLDPFLLLHHFGPVAAEPGFDPIDLGPHPHRGFEPVTFLYQGGLRHRDSRNNTGHLKAGDVQWMTAGRGIIHSERASQAFLEAGGTLEGIQLWVNLPARHKMVQPRYQDVKAETIPVIELGTASRLRVVAGTHRGVTGPVETYTSILAAQLSLAGGDRVELPLTADHQALIYLLHGEAKVNDNFVYAAPKLISFRTDGDGVILEGSAEQTEILLLTGEPLREPVASHGPFVMNTQTEIMEAMRDYQMGKMGFYVEE